MNTLVIGNKNYSSWSLRPWILMKELGIDFEEVRIPLFEEGYKEEILKHSPSGKVPALCSEGVTVWDSLAICEYIAEQFPGRKCWPENHAARAMARSVSHEMHSGFFEIRNSLPMNCKREVTFKNISPLLQAEVDRVCEIWTICRERYGGSGDFLFGRFSIADAMYAPVVLRFNSYTIEVGGLEKVYMQSMMSLDSVQEWLAGAMEEKEHIPGYEVDAE